MKLKFLVYQSFFVAHFRYLIKLKFLINSLQLTLRGFKSGIGTHVYNCHFTWPHQVLLGDNCKVEHGVYFHYDGIYSEGPSIIIGNNVFIGNLTEFNISKKITVGDNCLIASGCKFVDHSHGFKLDMLINSQKGSREEIIIESDVWLGCNAIILEGVKIGQGAIIGASSLVNKSIPANEIWAGIPAKKIGERN